MATHDFTGKRILVTGAGKGIGRETVQWLSRCGAEVIAAGRNPADLAYCERTLVVDLADAAATQAAVENTLPIDLLVNCAGVVELESVLDTSVETFDHLMAVNARAPMVVAQAVARDLIRRGRPGAIVNVSSLAAAVGTPDHLAYCASKAALDAMTRVMAVELGRHGIRVNSVNPVVTLTPMAEKAWSDPAKSASMLSRIPLGRFVQPDEIASAIAFLLSDDAAMVNGVTLTVDGGFSAG
ncbi:SDR family oxidoreductase [Pseudomonas sp. GD03842]|uniref:SDR family oxidoreductase n=1 Tax=unclassified Pseudomonas TaxID=196821 RepID=UPI000D3BF018|nr:MULTISPECIES: SDR family oxidoreductase [unclassified Pseudomonas]MDH0747129.1 SDR family oxidoreductase [Pseudomonas sp. GD03842]RAU44685.1 SDR family NAD(P)-dependent oxidoreductase [Pseudomonas sp. RIT 409]RAU55149.1 SDR family NAD(P)-dependent oxidoreductase [Pseudomonas sp. RIT 412]